MNIPKNVFSKVFKSICKINIEYIDNDGMTCTITGFFIKISQSLKYLITYCQFMQKESIKNIIIEIWNKKTINLSLNGRFIKYFSEPKNIIVLEIKNTDNIFNDIEFLDYIVNNDNSKNDYSIFKNREIFTVEFIEGKEEKCAKGKITDVQGYEFIHNINASNICSGCPIILLNKKITKNKKIKVIGIYTSGNFFSNMNYGCFIDKIIKEIEMINKNSNDKIIPEIDKKFNNINLNSEIILDKSISINESLDINSIKYKTDYNSMNPKQENLILCENSENAINLNIQSVDQNLNYSVKCKKTDIFNTIINKIFEKHPKYKEQRFYFICNGRVILEYKEIEGNKLKDGDTILLNPFEF